MTIRKLTTLGSVVFFGALGDVALARGMKQVGSVSFSHLGELFTAILTPWVGVGIVLLLGFFAAYLSSLSFADLTYVLPATSVGYIVMALLAKFFLHEQISVTRWIGIVMIVGGVGFVARGPSLTVRTDTQQALNQELQEASAGRENA